jgi:hypothetical protein
MGREASVSRGEARYGVNWSRGRSGRGAPRRAGAEAGGGRRQWHSVRNSMAVRGW